MASQTLPDEDIHVLATRLLDAVTRAMENTEFDMECIAQSIEPSEILSKKRRTSQRPEKVVKFTRSGAPSPEPLPKSIKKYRIAKSNKTT